MKLITENITEVKYLVEEKDEGKNKDYFIEGIFLQSEMKNRNGRMYRKEIMDREVKRYIKEYVEQNRAYGELGHPDSPTINLDRVAMMIKSLKEDGNNYVGKAKLMDTPMGRIAKSLIDEGARLGVSSRGLGSLKEEDGIQVVQDDFMLATAADIVADPSAPDAFVRGIMESKEWVFVDGKFVEKDIEAVKSAIQKTSSRKLAEQQVRAFTYFLSKL
jgi:hypothetical protein